MNRVLGRMVKWYHAWPSLVRNRRSNRHTPVMPMNPDNCGVDLEWYGWPDRPCDTKCVDDCRGRPGCQIHAAWRYRYRKEFGEVAADHYQYPHDPERNARVIKEREDYERRQHAEWLAVLVLIVGGVSALVRSPFFWIALLACASGATYIYNCWR